MPRDYRLEERTIGRVLADKADAIPLSPMLRWEGQVFGYGEVEAITNRYANGLLARGIAHGDHVAVMMDNQPEFLWLVWALGKIGAVAVPLNTAARGEMLRYFLEQSDASAMAIDAQFLDRMPALGTPPAAIRRWFIHGPAEAVSRARGMLPGAVEPLEAVCGPDASRPPLERVRHDDTHLIVYTSGTTGPSKGVMCPHSQAQGVGRAIAADYGYGPDDVLYTCLPLFHVNALWYTVNAALWADASVALSPRFSASRFWDEIRESGATQFNSLGAMGHIILKIPPGPHERDHRLRQCMVVPMNPEVCAQFQQRYGVQVTAVFGMSENYAVTNFVPGDRADKIGSAGSPRGASELRIVDDQGRDLPVGEVGEIVLRALHPGTMSTGYYRMPEKTAEAYVDGWFHTGDRGKVDADGYLWFVDRKKESIRRRGENISAFEVETIIARHPAILEVAAIPVPADTEEDEVMVYVVLRQGARLSAEELVRFAAESMSYFMVPRFVAFIDALPKTATEKIEKYKLKQDAVARRDSLWDRERAGIVIRR
jgi:crotonobetaine/carnitine-CoA ligase